MNQLLVGYQYATPCPDPGPPPARPAPADAERLNPEWAAAQRREERHLNRPLRAAVAVAVVIGLVLLVLGLTRRLDTAVATLGVICCALIAGVGGYAIWQGTRALRSRLAEEQARVTKLRAARESQLRASQEEHARRVRDWQARRVAYEHQKRWYPVCLPDGIRRVDIAGGTLPGWSALLTTVGAPRLAADGEVTVLDLSEGSVALDLVGFARAFGIEPLVLVLPGDLPRLGLTLARDALAEVLSLAVRGEDDQAQAQDLDHAILDRVVGVLGETATVAGVAAGLRALVGDPSDDVISAAQVERLGAIGRGAALERVWVLESRLRKLATVGTEPADMKGSALRVIALGPRAVAAEVLASYLALALTHALRATTPPGRHTLFVLGADRLGGDIVDRLGDVCENTGTGLVLAYRTMPGRVRRRLGHGNAAVAFMRLPDAEDARAASEQIGAERPLVLSQLTETIGRLVADTAAGAYTGTPDSAVSESVSAAISAGTAWGLATSKTASEGDSLAQLMQRSREFVADPRELRTLPPSAMIISYRDQVVLADANPGIGGLSAATELTLEEFQATPAVPAAEPGRDADGSKAAVPPGGKRPRPNLGPPPQRLDWRRRRS